MILPYQVDVPMERIPIANWVLIAFTILVSVATFPALHEDAEALPIWMLHGSGQWASEAGLLGATLTHADTMHLVGNMIFLFVFGNAVNAKLGHTLFLACYFFFGMVSAYAHGMISDGPALGASGAIAGITGMFIIFFSKNDVNVFYWLFLYQPGNFEVPAWIVVGCYFLKDVIFQIMESAGASESGVALMAHIGGSVAGAGIAMLLLLTDRIRPTTAEVTVLDMIRGQG
ncbi:MAG: rhomboid family intramembrane serine protease [Phycisphaerales bacterium]|nr:MAG: rhomboid family intramembrane serine protease [Phycisphaerales bacterium]